MTPMKSMKQKLDLKGMIQTNFQWTPQKRGKFIYFSVFFFVFLICYKLQRELKLKILALMYQKAHF